MIRRRLLQRTLFLRTPVLRLLMFLLTIFPSLMAVDSDVLSIPQMFGPACLRAIVGLHGKNFFRIILLTGMLAIILSFGTGAGLQDIRTT